MSPFEFLAEVQADLAATFDFTAYEGKLTWQDPYRLTRGDKGIEFMLLGSELVVGLSDHGKLGKTRALALTHDGAKAAVKVITDYFASSS